MLGGAAEKSGEQKKQDAVDSKSYREQNWFKEPEPVPQPTNDEELIEPVIEKIKDLVAQMPGESQQIDELLKEILPERNFQKNDLEELVAAYQEMPVFEKKEVEQEEAVADVELETEPEFETAPDPEPEPTPEPAMVAVEQLEEVEAEAEQQAKLNDVSRPRSLNETLGGGLNIGLNDRIAFIKHLFNGSNEDYSRVMSQISSFSTYQEAESFVQAQVKPEYDNWSDKEVYAERFMNIVERNFS